VESLPLARRRLVALAVVVNLAVGLTACSDGTSSAAPDSLLDIRNATFDAGSARYEGQLTFADGTEAPVQGTAAGEPAAGEVNVPVQTTTGVQDGAMRWLDGTLYIQRVPGNAANAVTGSAGVFVGADAVRPWVRLPVTGLGAAVLSTYDPFLLLDQLSAANATVTFRADGTESVSGRRLDRFVVEPAEGAAGVVRGYERAELLTDDAGRLQVARLSGSESLEYTLSDFGTTVTVEPPTPDQIAEPVTGNNSEDPIGAYEQVATGSVEGVAWRLMRAPASGDGSCWRLDVDGDQTARVAATEDDGASCIAALDPSVDEAVQVVADPSSSATFDAVVAVAPSGSQAIVRFVDQSSKAVAVDERGFLVWVGSREPMLVVLDVTLPDGSTEECGPGSVSDLGDLDSIDPSQWPRLRDAPWLCIAG
jgi:hypothetical protein